ncbi:uncharacterized protein [Cherax quadricarinatus]|uniref:uncharacterized protein n=1 Tax=Cherax quadricarinatus TaxID=27406 RepID=UPI00387E5AC0
MQQQDEINEMEPSYTVIIGVCALVGSVTLIRVWGLPQMVVASIWKIIAHWVMLRAMAVRRSFSSSEWSLQKKMLDLGEAGFLMRWKREFIRGSVILGSGTYADVYTVNETAFPSHPPLCVKKFKKYRLALEQACDEAHKLLQVKSVTGVPHLVGICVRPPAIIMTQHGSVTLYDYLSDILSYPGDLSILRVLRRLCVILDDIHQLDLTHNDVKQDNVSVEVKSDDVVVTLLDFGFLTPAGHVHDHVLNKFNPKGNLKLRAENEELRRQKYPWYAPELFLDNIASRASDTYSLIRLVKLCLRIMRVPPPGITRWIIKGMDLNPVVRPTLSRFGHYLSEEIGRRLSRP